MVSKWPAHYSPTFPTIDESRPGHYTTVMFDTENEDNLRKIIQPRSTVLKEKFSELGGSVPDVSLQTISRDVNLPVEEVSVWFDHLRTVVKNRQR